MGGPTPERSALPGVPRNESPEGQGSGGQIPPSAPVNTMGYGSQPIAPFSFSVPDVPLLCHLWMWAIARFRCASSNWSKNTPAILRCATVATNTPAAFTNPPYRLPGFLNTDRGTQRWISFGIGFFMAVERTITPSPPTASKPSSL